VLQIGDIDWVMVYVSLAPGMEHPARVDPPADNVAQCCQYTSSEDDVNQPAPTTNDRVVGKRTMVVGSSQAGAASVGAAPGRVTGQGSASGSRVPKRHRLLRFVDDDDEEEETAPTLVRKPQSRPDVAPADGGRVAQDPPTAHIKQAQLSRGRVATAAGRVSRRVFTTSHRSSNL